MRTFPCRSLGLPGVIWFCAGPCNNEVINMILFSNYRSRCRAVVKMAHLSFPRCPCGAASSSASVLPSAAAVALTESCLDSVSAAFLSVSPDVWATSLSSSLLSLVFEATQLEVSVVPIMAKWFLRWHFLRPRPRARHAGSLARCSLPPNRSRLPSCVFFVFYYELFSPTC